MHSFSRTCISFHGSTDRSHCKRDRVFPFHSPGKPVLEHPVCHGRSGSRRNDLLFLGCPTHCIHREQAWSGVVNSSHEELDVKGVVPVVVQDVGEESRGGGDRHRSPPPDIVETALHGHDPCDLLGISHPPCNGHSDSIRDLVHFICFL